MPITMFMHLESGKLVIEKHVGFSTANCFWNTKKVKHLDKDADKDFLVVTWELITTINKPISHYFYNFDYCGIPENIITYYYHGNEGLLANKDEMRKNWPYLTKKYLYDIAFVEAKLTDLISKVKLKNAQKMQVFEIASSYFENMDCTLNQRSLLLLTQPSTVNDIMCHEVNDKGLAACGRIT